MTSSINTPEPGMTGLAVEPWTPGEVYAVAAHWAEASSPVYEYGRAGWQLTCCQVADYRHRAEEALRRTLEEALVMGGMDPEEAEEEAAEIAADAYYIEYGDE